MPIFRDREYLRVELEKSQDESLWMQCKACGELVFKRRVRENNNICPNCGEYFFLTAPERIESLIDEGTFVDISQPIVAGDPLGFVDSKPYPERIEAVQERTGLPSAILIATAEMDEMAVLMAVMDFRFVGGSMGSVVGEQMCYGMEQAMERGIPFILISSSGGARIQEGMYSLMQMAKTAAVRERLAARRVPFISVMAYPTTGGVQASIASLGDIIIAERGALIGFAGRRVIRDTTGEDLPANFQTDTFAFERGFIDRVVNRENLRGELIHVVRFFQRAEKRD